MEVSTVIPVPSVKLDGSTVRDTAPVAAPPAKPEFAFVFTADISPVSAAAAIVIAPSAFVIVMLEPAVSVPTAGPDVPPISSSPFPSICAAANVSVPLSCEIITDLSSKAVAPVPPLATANVEDNPAAVPDVF